MKYLTFDKLLSINLNISWHKETKWGRQQTNNIIGWCKKYNYVIIDIFCIFIQIKKIISIVNYVSNRGGISLSVISSNMFISNKFWLIKKRKAIKNFYVVHIDKIYGFLTNFNMFLKKGPKHYKYVTNYLSGRLPDVVFMSKNVWKDYMSFFSFFIKFKIISITITSFLQKDINICYNIMINNSKIIHNLLKWIHNYNMILLIKYVKS